MEKIHIHTDIESLMFFSDKNGVCAYNSRVMAYAMQHEHIVGVFYNKKQLESFYEHNKHKEGLPIIYFWDEKRWNDFIQKNTNPPQSGA